MKKVMVVSLCLIMVCGVLVGYGKTETSDKTSSESVQTPTPTPTSEATSEASAEATIEVAEETAMPSEAAGEVKTKQFVEIQFEYNDGLQQPKKEGILSKRLIMWE